MQQPRWPMHDIFKRKCRMESNPLLTSIIEAFQLGCLFNLVALESHAHEDKGFPYPSLTQPEALPQNPCWRPNSGLSRSYFVSPTLSVSLSILPLYLCNACSNRHTRLITSLKRCTCCKSAKEIRGWSSSPDPNSLPSNHAGAASSTAKK